MAAAYSTRFYAAAGVTGEHTVYTVPAGYLAVVHCISCYSNNTGGDVFVKLDTTNSVVWHHNFPSDLSGPHWADWNGRCVYGPGESIVVKSTGPIVDIQISGYLLSV